MIKKRIAAAVVVKNDRVVQSFSFSKYLPLGSVPAVIENLDRWGVDDILILNIDRTSMQLGPNIDLIQKIASIPISTPLTYGGGIRSVVDAIDVISNGAERVVVDGLLFNSPNELESLSKAVGSQAIVLSIPFKILGGQIFHFNYLANSCTRIDLLNLKQYEKIVSEVLLIDVESEGHMGMYANDVADYFAKMNIDLVCYGGVGLHKQGSVLLGKDNVSAVAYGNILNYGELFFQQVKRSLAGQKNKLRRSIYRDRI